MKASDAPVSSSPAASVDPREVALFGSLAEEWWDPRGSSKLLHAINPVRLAYIRSQALDHFARDDAARAPFSGLRALDVGCGGGILSESMAKTGATVRGIDLSTKALKVADLHSLESGVQVRYEHIAAEEMAAREAGQYDVVTCMEMLEHVPDPAAIVKAAATLVKPGGHVFFSTINRNPKSYVMAIIGAEQVMRWLPRGTHDWRKFITPDELFALLRGAGLRPVDRTGMVFDPLAWSWRLSERDLSVNYVTASVRD